MARKRKLSGEGSPRTASDIGSTWRDTPNPAYVSGKQKRAGKYYVRAMHRPGMVHAYHVPSYASIGDELADAVRASIAREMLASIAAL